jgi:hypothetical protein
MQYRQDLVFNFLSWVMTEFVQPALREAFYITESGDTAHFQRLFFFRHGVWQAVSHLSSTLLVRVSEQFQPLAPKEARSILEGRPFGWSYIRLLPKANTVRPITNLGRKPTPLPPVAHAVNPPAVNNFVSAAAGGGGAATSVEGGTSSASTSFAPMPPTVAGAPPPTTHVFHSINSMLQNLFCVLTHEKVFLYNLTPILFHYCS